jgi:hypothetical protein
VNRRHNRLLACLTVLAVVCAGVQAVTGVAELTLLFLVAALLISGRFVAEHRIVARWRANGRRPRFRETSARPRPARERPLGLLLERIPQLERGPPVVLRITI